MTAAVRVRGDRLTPITVGIEWLPRAALKRRHVLFSGAGYCCIAPMRAVVGLNLQ